MKVLQKKALKTFTTYRGKEFACYKEVEKLNIKVYFADAYAAWQRGSNENSNGLLREYYPKKTDLGQISNDDLIKKLILLNSRPRKCLNWDNPFNLFLKEGRTWIDNSSYRKNNTLKDYFKVLFFILL